MRHLTAIGFTAIFIAGALHAQTTATGTGTAATPDVATRPHRAGPPAPGGPGPRGFGMRELNLTPEQRTAHQQIFDNERQTAQPVQEQLRKVRDTLDQAVKSGASESNIDLLAAQAGPLFAQLEAIHAKAAGKFYASLTPEQKLKYDAMAARPRGPNRGARPGPPPPPRPAQ